MRKPKKYLVLASLCLTVSSLSIVWPARTPPSSYVVSEVTLPSTFAAQTFRRIFVVQLENRAYETVIQHPYFAELASRGRSLTNYRGITHPSQPNYIAQLAGAPLISDNALQDLPESNLVDLLETKSVSWKAYMEDYPGACYARSSANSGLYVRKHNPFISFDSIRNSATRCAKIVNATQLDADIATNMLPQFSYYTPNQDNNSHDTSIDYAATWLRTFLEPKLSNTNFMSGTLVVLTFDEDDSKHDNHIYTALLSESMLPGVDATAHNHYSLLRTIEDNFELGNLGRNDAIAVPFALSTPFVTPPPGPSPTLTPGPSFTPTTSGPSPTPTLVATIDAPAGTPRIFYLPAILHTR